jgi:uncharacterized membrane protein
MILLLHILAGGVGLLSGYVALYAAKGAPLHRRSGLLFVCVMLPMAIAGMLIAAIEGVAPAINVPTALLTFYLVITSLMTVRSSNAGSRRLDFAGMLIAFAVAVACFTLGVKAIANGGAAAGMAYPLFLFGGVGLAAGVGDRRMIRAGGVHGATRLKRHLWRMCFALFLAAMAFFLGQADVFPKPLRIRPLLALPVLAVLATMFYWQWRLRSREKSQRTAGLRTLHVPALSAFRPE